MFEVRAISSIPSGSELTISYLDDVTLCLPSDHRNASLAPYGFSCVCQRCQLPAEPLIEGVRCTQCCFGVCSYRKPTADSDGFYVCVAALSTCPSAEPCGATLDLSALDEKVSASYATMQLAIAATSDIGDSDTTTVSAVSTALATVLRDLPPEHWIAYLLAVRLSTQLQAVHVQRLNPLSLVAAERIRLLCLEAALHPYDYALSNCHDRLAAAWIVLAAVGSRAMLRLPAHSGNRSLANLRPPTLPSPPRGNVRGCTWSMFGRSGR